MSTGLRQSLADAVRNADAFINLFDARSYQRWEIAGSVRRRKPEVGDVEHVLVPNFGEVEDPENLFGGKKAVNLLLRETDRLLERGIVRKHLYGETGFRWGEKHRGIEFEGVLHELFLCEWANFGPTLLIRTGSDEFSRRVVTAFKDGGMYRQQDGYLTHVASGDVVPVSTEEKYLKLAGLPWVEPEDRR